MRITSCVAIWMLLSGAAMAQTMVEAGALTSAGGTATAKAGKTAGSAVTNALGNLSKTLDAAKRSNTPAPATKAVALPVAKAPEVQPGKPERDVLLAVKEGSPKADLLAKAGQPSFAITSPEDGHLVEVLSYTTKDGAKAKVRLSDGKVSSIEWPQSK